MLAKWFLGALTVCVQADVDDDVHQGLVQDDIEIEGGADNNHLSQVNGNHLAKDNNHSGKDNEQDITDKNHVSDHNHGGEKDSGSTSGVTSGGIGSRVLSDPSATGSGSSVVVTDVQTEGYYRDLNNKLDEAVRLGIDIDFDSLLDKDGSGSQQMLSRKLEEELDKGFAAKGVVYHDVSKGRSGERLLTGNRALNGAFSTPPKISEDGDMKFRTEAGVFAMPAAIVANANKPTTPEM